MLGILKAGREVVVEWVGDNFNMVWRVGVAAGDWKNAVMISIHITKAADGIAGNKLKETNY